MKKRFLSIFLVIILAVTNVTVSYADGLDDLSNIGVGNYGETITNEFTDKNNTYDEIVTPDIDTGSWHDDKGFEGSTGLGITKVVTTILDFIFDGMCYGLLLSLDKIPGMDSIIFSESATVDNSFWGTMFRLSYFDNTHVGIAGQLVVMVSSAYQIFRYIALIGFVIAIACIAVKMIVSSVGKQKQQYKEMLKNWLIGLVLLIVGHWIMIYLIYFADFLVEIIVQIKDSVITTIGMPRSWDEYGVTLLSEGKLTEKVTLMGAFAYALDAMDANNEVMVLGLVLSILNFIFKIIAIIVFAVLNLKIMKVYLERIVIVGILIMLFPLVTLMYAFEKAGLRKGNTFSGWLKTYVEQVFLQPIHAVALFCSIVVITGLANTGLLAQPIINVILLITSINLVFKIENVFTKLVAINAEGLGKPTNPAAAAAVGLAAAPGIVKGVGKLGSSVFHHGRAIAYKLTGKSSSIKNGMSDSKKESADKWGAFSEGKLGRVTTRVMNGASTFANSNYVKNLTGGALAAAGLHAPVIYGKKGGEGEDSKSDIKDLRIKIDTYKKARDINPDLKDKNNTGARSAFNSMQAGLDKYLNGVDKKKVEEGRRKFDIDNVHDIQDPAKMAALLAYLKDTDGIHNVYNSDGSINYDRAYDEAFNSAKPITSADYAKYDSPKFDGTEIQNELTRLAHCYGDSLEKAIDKAFDGMSDKANRITALNSGSGTKEDFIRVTYALEHSGADMSTIDDSKIKKWLDNKIKG